MSRLRGVAAATGGATPRCPARRIAAAPRPARRTAAAARPARRIAAATGGAAALALAAALGTAPAAGAATTYAYWSYWHKAPGATSWVYSNTGAYYYRPADGSVEGWRFGTGRGGPSDPPPRASGSYRSLCSTAPSAAGVQVALVLDFGSSLRKACVTVPAGSSGSTVLTKAGANPRYNSSGLLCSISGYPRTGCGQVVASPTPAPAPVPSASRPAPAPTGGDADRDRSSSGGSGSGATGRSGPSATSAAGRSGGSGSGATTSPRTGVTNRAAGASAGASTPAARRSASASATTGTASPAPLSAPSEAAAESFAPVATQSTAAGGGFPTGLALGGAAIAALVAGAVVQARRRS